MSFDLKIFNGDIVINNSGDLDTVFDNDKLRQDIIKILLTKLGENSYHATYGCKIGALEVGHVVDRDILEIDLRTAVETAIKYLIRAQQDQAKYQYLTPGEIIAGIKDIQVYQNQLDPRMFNIFIAVFTKKLTIITETIPVKII